MRGKKISIAKKQVDLILVSVRIHPDSGTIEFARGYERRGPVWGDIKLFDRESLIEELKEGKKVVTGASLPLVGDFEIYSPVRLGSGDQLLAGDAHEANGDDLGLPML